MFLTRRSNHPRRMFLNLLRTILSESGMTDADKNETKVSATASAEGFPPASQPSVTTAAKSMRRRWLVRGLKGLIALMAKTR